jgi:eukaryotic-like serine/threonine-protein kinase
MNDTQILRADTSLPTSPGADSHATPLPPDLLQEAIHRLGILALIYASTYTAAFGAGFFLYDLQQRFHGGPRPGDLIIGASSISISLLFYALCRSRAFAPMTLLRLGLVYEVVGAFGIDIGRFWMPATHAIGGISWSCVWIVCFGGLMPMRRSTALIGSLCAASAGPAALAVSLAAGAASFGDLPVAETLVALFLPNYLCAIIASVPAQILYNLGHAVTRARQAGSYELLDQLGSGGMGEVWSARHRMLARPAAIKLVKPEALGAEGSRTDAVLRRFELEAHAIASLRSPHTVMLYDYGRTDSGLLYYAMEYLEGLDLQGLVDRFGVVSPARAVFLLDQALHSLAEAHWQGLLHRDIKPGNLFLTHQAGEFDFVKVLDFGLVKEMRRRDERSPTLTSDGSILGTPLYMAPERFYGDEEADHRADLYAIGAVAYFLMSGRPVFDAKNPVQVLLQQARTVPASLRSRGVELSEKLDAAVLRALEKEPSARFDNADKFRLALRATPEWGAWSQVDAEQWWRAHVLGQPVPELAAAEDL